MAVGKRQIATPGERRGERLRDAAVRGDAAAVLVLLGSGTGPNPTDAHGDTALHKAAQYGHLTVVQALNGAGAKLDMHGWDGRTPLIEAALYGNSTCLEELLLAGANPWLKVIPHHDTFSTTIQPPYSSTKG